MEVTPSKPGVSPVSESPAKQTTAAFDGKEVLDSKKTVGDRVRLSAQVYEVADAPVSVEVAKDVPPPAPREIQTQKIQPKPPSQYSRPEYSNDSCVETDVEQSIAADLAAKEAEIKASKLELEVARRFESRQRSMVAELTVNEKRVRSHEEAHARVGGRWVHGASSYDYLRGPDGHRYAVEGKSVIDNLPIRSDPMATIQKMQQVRRAALAPVDPSYTDFSVAREAASIERQARRVLELEHSEQVHNNDIGVGINLKLEGGRNNQRRSGDKSDAGLGEVELDAVERSPNPGAVQSYERVVRPPEESPSLLARDGKAPKG